MRVIAKPAIDQFVRKHPNTKEPLYSWFKIVEKTQFANFNELRATFPSADVVKNNKGVNLTVFNIGGNNTRLIAAIHYDHSKLYIRYILTHAEYDKEKWKN